MPVVPERNNAQHQPLTTALKNIIREYPAGGGVLRELTQNADDAGSKFIEFILDEKDYTKENLLHKDLAQYQGISLLAYNDSKFTKIDFESLTRIGDSAKAQDLTSTGKFGRGFNSVYNWTDTPSIISGTSFLFLDPHEGWTADVGSPGGPLYNFVENAHEPTMANQLSVFEKIIKNFDTEFDGTIIRLPLRTEAQAKESKIVDDDKHTPRDEIIDTFQKFSEALVDSMLFLKNIERITLRVGDKIYAQVESTASCRDGGTTNPKQRINEGYQAVFVHETEQLRVVNFIMNICLLRDEIRKDFKFAISHHLTNVVHDLELKKWARKQKLFPWTAIASPLEDYESFEGSLFTILPLKFKTPHPVHIHGMFSITPDRASIHTEGDSTLSELSEAKLGAKWNKWLFRECVVSTWINRLRFLPGSSAEMEGTQSEPAGWKLWPAGVQGDSKELWMGLLRLVFEKILKENLPLLPTLCGSTGKRDRVLFKLEVPISLKNALRSAKANVVSPPDDKKYELKFEAIGLKALSPCSARIRLTELKDLLRDLSEEDRNTLLDYVLSDKNYKELGTCRAPLLPMRNGELMGFDKNPGGKCLLTLNDAEDNLFEKMKNGVIDTKRLSDQVLKQMRARDDRMKLRACTRVTDIRMGEAVTYCKDFVFSKSASKEKEIFRGDDFQKFVCQFWRWIDRNYAPKARELEFLADLWLVPLGGQVYRKAKQFTLRTLDISSKSSTSDFLREITLSLDETYENQYPLHAFGDSGITSIIRKFNFIVECEDLLNLVQWLVGAKDFVNKMSGEGRMLLLENLGVLSSRYRPHGNSAGIIQSGLKELPIFNEISSRTSNERKWISLNEYGKKYVALKISPLTISHQNTVFIDIADNYTEKLVRNFKLAECPTLTETLTSYIIPKLSNQTEENLRLSLARFALDNFHALSISSKSDLSKVNIVPVIGQSGIFKSPLEVVDPASIAAPLFFEDEGRIPAPEFLSSYRSVLISLGMITSITKDVILDRISKFSEPGLPLALVKEKSRILLASETLDLQSSPPTPFPHEILQLRWIPAGKLKETEGLFSAYECRDLSQKQLVKYTMPIAKCNANITWNNLLAWNVTLSIPTILSQLDGAVSASDTTSLGHLVGYIETQGLFELLESELKKNPWIPGGGGCYYRASDVFLGSATGLSPYFGTLDGRFVKKFDFFERLGVKLEPSFDQYKGLQDKLAEKEKFSSIDLNVALKVLEHVGQRFSKKKTLDFRDLKAPDSNRKMWPLSELTAGDSALENTDLHILHPRVSPEIIQQLNIASQQDRFLESINDSEFDFAQTEDITTVIEDTLKRYSIMSTFDEYLANAEDCGTASKISWLVDKVEHPIKHLVSQKLSEAQGPALVCYNDGKFSKDDLGALTKIGIGSKRKNTSTIGRFGRGSLTMYHWTSTPNLISGEWFVIFDPERQYLPVIPGTKRSRAGMKIKIEDVRKNCPDQLKPFEGLFGFDSKSTCYDGTIFRFPFRNSKAKSKLTVSKFSVNDTLNYVREYFNNARISLLFLQRIFSISCWERAPSDHGATKIWEVSSEDIEGIKLGPSFKHKVIKEARGGNPEVSSEWCTAVRTLPLEHIQDRRLSSIARNERVEARYGLAAIIKCAGLDVERSRGRYFMDLPLASSLHSNLPVHINASFIMPSNRQFIPIETSNGQGEEWNRWILEECVAPLYLSLLEYLMQSKGKSAYSYWPITTGRYEPATEIVAAAFWKKALTSSCNLYCPESNAKSGEGDPQENLALSDAIFNFLDNENSKLILPLLLELDIDFIIHTPCDIKSALKKADPGFQSVSTISSSFVLEILRSCKSQFFKIWEKSYKFSPTLCNKILSFIVSNDDTPPESLIGCTILPLANNTLGLFSTHTPNKNFLVAETELEHQILEIAPSLSVHPKIDKKLVKELIADKNLNVARLQFSDIPRLFEGFNEKPIEFKYQWLKHMWSYYEKCLRTSPDQKTAFLTSLSPLPVHFASAHGLNGNPITKFLTRDILGKAILQPSVLDRGCSVVNAFKGIWKIDQDTFPNNEKAQERITEPYGLYSFLVCISSQAAAESLSIESFVTKYLSAPTDIRDLKDRLNPGIWPQLKLNFPHAVDILREIPLWKTSGETYLPATKALLPPHRGLDVSGIVDGSSFVHKNVVKSHGQHLTLLNVKEVPWEDFLNIHFKISQGNKLPTEKLEGYGAFIISLEKHAPDAFAKYPLAIDGNREYCKVNTLYDHRDPLFFTAFRDVSKAHFLHPQLRNEIVWNELGLKHEPKSDAYLSSARSIQRRRDLSVTVEDNQLFQDAVLVFSQLQWEIPELRRWQTPVWSELSKIGFAPVKVTFTDQPVYRRNRMSSLIMNQRLLTLSQAITINDIDIAWSQYSILHTIPSPLVLGNMPGNGRPSLSKVLDHLIFLSSNRHNVSPNEIPSYIADIKKSYEYLQKGKYQVPSEVEIWLNVEAVDPPRSISIQEFQNSWKCSTNLCLNLPYESDDLEHVYSFLSPFTQLLERSGVHRIKPPSLQPVLVISDSYPSAILQGFQRFRNQRLFFDVKVKVGNQVFEAHRAVLSAASNYWEVMFTSGLRESSENIVTIHEISPATVSALLDYIYTGRMNEVDEDHDITENLESLIEQLYTSYSWNLQGLKAQLENFLLRSVWWIRPETVKELLQCAKDVKAVNLENTCSKYIQDNYVILQREGS